MEGNETDEEFRLAARRAVRRQMLFLLPMVAVIGLIMAGIDALTGHTALAIGWGISFVVVLGAASALLMRR